MCWRVRGGASSDERPNWLLLQLSFCLRVRPRVHGIVSHVSEQNLKKNKTKKMFLLCLSTFPQRRPFQDGCGHTRRFLNAPWQKAEVQTQGSVNRKSNFSFFKNVMYARLIARPIEAWTQVLGPSFRRRKHGGAALANEHLDERDQQHCSEFNAESEEEENGRRSGQLSPFQCWHRKTLSRLPPARRTPRSASVRVLSLSL